MSKLGTFVRARQAQLQYCYMDVGLAVNANLAGSVSVTISMDPAGVVTDAKVASRTWSGAGVAEAESCLLQRVKGWAFPPSAKVGTESYSFSFIFNR
jgi:TonB family protein